MNLFIICFHWRNWHFELRMLLFSVGMNAPRYWQWRNERSTAIGNCAKETLTTAQRASYRRWLGCNSVSRGFSNCKWKMTIKRVLLTLNIFKHHFCLYHSFSSLCVACIYMLSYTVQYSLPMQVEGGGGLDALQRERGTSVQPLKKPTNNIVLPFPTAWKNPYPRWEFVSK
jgi:hypothetical protein